MATERREGPTPHGGAYALATFLNLKTFTEVEREDADGLVISEYAEDGTLIWETVGVLPGLLHGPT